MYLHVSRWNKLSERPWAERRGFREFTQCFCIADPSISSRHSQATLQVRRDFGDSCWLCGLEPRRRRVGRREAFVISARAKYTAPLLLDDSGRRTALGRSESFPYGARGQSAPRHFCWTTADVIPHWGVPKVSPAAHGAQQTKQPRATCAPDVLI